MQLDLTIRVRTLERDLDIDYRHVLTTQSCSTPNSLFESQDERRHCQTTNDMLLVELQLQAFVSGYIVPHEGGRGRLQAARAWPEYFGRRCYSDIGVAGANDARWYARALLFFRAGKHDSKWDERAHKRVPTVQWIDLVFVR